MMPDDPRAGLVAVAVALLVALFVAGCALGLVLQMWRMP